MIGFINRGLVLIFGYAYPAFECYKFVEMNKPNIEQLRFWCQYWILAAVLMICESIGDVVFGWIPMYSEAKLAFFIYLWYPKTKGSKYVYESFLRPFIAKHEKDIDRHLLELRTRAGDMAFLYWQRSAGYLQTRIFDILRYIASQTVANQPAQPKHEVNHATQPQASSAASSTDPKEPAEEEAQDSKVAPMNEHKTTPTPPQTPNANKDQEKQVDPTTPSAKGGASSPTIRDLIMDEARPLARARLRRVNTPPKY